jgi:sodium-independent sulfate anion transporter 11
MAPNSVGRTLAKGLGINVDYRKEEPLTSGAASISSVETCTFPISCQQRKIAYPGPDVEKEPTVSEWLSQFKPSLGAFQRYLRSLFPFWNWIFHYNLTWLFGDVIAGK